ncbi:hypothetical protein F9L04_26125 [Brucella anthropi]|uniref:Uncharacterized protein n=1 Tax=Brucella anthropi TaxID=529 RepID=A0A6L3YXX9_BRUAN|nr:hypothetical protein [Brucella anthropi]KAB2754844.1 hypothetical protein F9L04_26125 [Brucella anthropi]
MSLAACRATIVAQIIKLGQKLTDDAVMMFIKLMGRLFSQVNNRKKQRHMSARLETSKALRLFLDKLDDRATIVARRRLALKSLASHAGVASPSRII